MKPVVLPEDDVRYVTRNSLSFSCVSCRTPSSSSLSNENLACRMNEDDRKDLDAAKVKNRETTEAARRALQVARETQEVAEHTLAALDSQNQKIRRLDGKMVEMKEDGEPSPHPRKRIPLRSVDSARPPPLSSTAHIFWAGDIAVPPRIGPLDVARQGRSRSANAVDSPPLPCLRRAPRIVKRSENYLRYITRTCVCFNCFVTDPTTKEEGKWSEEAKAKQKAEKKVKAKKPVAAAGKGADLQRRDSGTAQKLKIVGDGQPAPLMVAEAAELKEVQADFAEQDAAMDEISGVVGSLGEMSRALGEEIAKQNALLDEVDSKATPLKDRIREMNTRTRLSKMQIKKKESGGSIINDVGSTLIKKSLN